jgi:hypothetical protein
MYCYLEQATKLVELYKQSSDEWSQKSHDLEAVIKALEVSLFCILLINGANNTLKVLCRGYFMKDCQDSSW